MDGPPKKKRKKKRKKNPDEPEGSTALAKRPKPGAAFYSNWYTRKLIHERISNVRKELAERHLDGDLKQLSEWQARAKRRFDAAWNRLSEESRTSYQASARHFGKYLGMRQAKVSEIIAQLIALTYLEACTLVEEYMAWMREEKELSPNMINRHLSALRFLVDTCRRIGWCEYRLDVKQLKTERVKDVDAPSKKDFRRYLLHVQRTVGQTAARNKLLVYMLAFMGMRISSVLSLEYQNIDFKKRRFKVRWKGDGKQYKWRPAGPKVMEALAGWIDQRGHHKGHIFTNFDPARKGKGSITRRSAEHIVTQLGIDAGTKKRMTTHMFRHFYTDDNLEATNQNTRDVSTGLGHKDIKTIEHYVSQKKSQSRARQLVEAMEQRWLSEGEEEDQKLIEEEEEPEIEIPGVVSAEEAVKNRIVYETIKSKIESVDKVLSADGGLVIGSLTLFGGDAGIGKSTLVRQMCAGICRADKKAKILYASGEEPVPQLAEGLERIGCYPKTLKLMNDQSLDNICDAADALNVDVLVIDSINSVGLDENQKPVGSVTQLKGCANHLKNWSKGEDGKDIEGTGIAVIIIVHVDKKGNISGPKMLEHFVDTVLVFSGQKQTKPRILSQNKNRFGPTTKMAFFEMTNTGLLEKNPPASYDDDFDDGPVNTFGENEEGDDFDLEDEDL